MDVLERPVLTADHRVAYGAVPGQFGDLWLPAGHGPFPLVVFFHGGWWKAEYDLGYAGYFCRALKQAGIAVWSVEYHRVGFFSSGWPQTFLDAAAGYDYAVKLAKSYPLDLTRMIVAGHSAGGHLAFWIAGRAHVAHNSEIFRQPVDLHPRAVVALAGAVDLRLTIDLAGDGEFAHDRDEVRRLMGGLPADVPERYKAGNPGDLLPFQAPQYLLQGTADDQIPPQLPARWVAQARRVGSHATVTNLPGADHLAVVDPESSAWPAVLAAIKAALAG